MSNLFARILTGLILLPIVIYTLIFGGFYLIFLLSIIGFIGTLEIAQMVLFNKKQAYCYSILNFLGIFIPFIFCSNILEILACLTLLFLIFNLYILFSKEDKETYEKLSIIFYFSLYLFIGLTTLFLLYDLKDSEQNKLGLSFIYIACIATWANDIFAYFGGKAFGKRPLFLRVSQKKTWEGFFFGLAGSFIMVFLIEWLFLLGGIELYFGLKFIDKIFILLPSFILAPLGDLIESRLKRLYFVKDSSKILPGHGGILDRIDGLLLVLPWSFIYAYFIRNWI